MNICIRICVHTLRSENTNPKTMSQNNDPTSGYVLEKLNISHNKIEKLENLPNNLEELYCSNNEITEIRNIPSNIRFLDCS